MKLLRLKLNTKFRSLPEGFELYFLRDWSEQRAWEFSPYCFAGLNGSGKSNVLEALAAIFYHIECIYLNYRPDGFEADEEGQSGFSADRCYPDAFELEYLVPHPDVGQKIAAEPLSLRGRKLVPFPYKIPAQIRIAKERGKAPKITWVNRKDIEPSAQETELNRTEVKDKLPDFVVAYSSGENEIISLPFFKMRFIQFDEYRDKLLKAEDYFAPEARMVYLDNQFSQAIFLCNLLFQPGERLKVFEQEIGVEGIAEFRIVIRRDFDLEMDSDYIRNLPSEKQQDERETRRELTHFMEDTIEKFRKCATAYFYDHDRNLLYLDYAVNEATKQAFRHHFEKDAFVLFQQFQILLTLNLFQVSPEAKKELYNSSSLFAAETVGVLPHDQRIFRFDNFLLKKRSLEDGLYSKSLSDGEHQFLHSIGLCLLFKDMNTLFLLDEPETHLNPDWRAKFISTLRDCLKPEIAMYKTNMTELLITSHSPFIISDCRREEVRIFRRDKETGTVFCEEPKINTFGTSVNILTEEIFGKKESIPDLALEKINALKNRPMETEEDIQAIKEESRELGESVEKILLFRELIIKEDELKRKKDA